MEPEVEEFVSIARKLRADPRNWSLWDRWLGLVAFQLALVEVGRPYVVMPSGFWVFADSIDPDLERGFEVGVAALEISMQTGPQTTLRDLKIKLFDVLLGVVDRTMFKPSKPRVRIGRMICLSCTPMSSRGSGPGGTTSPSGTAS